MQSSDAAEGRHTARYIYKANTSTVVRLKDRTRREQRSKHSRRAEFTEHVPAACEAAGSPRSCHVVPALPFCSREPPAGASHSKVRTHLAGTAIVGSLLLDSS